MAVRKDKKLGTWYFDIQYRDSTGKRRSLKRKGFETEQKAKNAERKMHREMKKDDLPTSTRTMRDIGLEYIANKRHDVKEGTYETYRRHVNTFLPNTQIGLITTAKALKWRNSLATMCTPVIKKKNGETTGGKMYSTTTKNDAISLFKSVFKYAMSREYIHRDVTFELKPFKKTFEEAKQSNVISAEDFFNAWDLLPTATWIDKIFKAFILTSFATGARRAEIKGLSFNDYDGNSIHIYKSVPGKSSDRNLIEKTKTPASVRHVELDDFTNSYLREFAQECKSHPLYSPDGFLFGFNSAFPNNTIQTKYKKMNLNCRLHDLRHSHATLLIQNNVPINVVSKRLGHTNVEMTLKVYTHIFVESQDQAVNVLNNAFKITEK